MGETIEKIINKHSKSYILVSDVQATKCLPVGMLSSNNKSNVTSGGWNNGFHFKCIKTKMGEWIVK
jgi:hypothetical protein